jgi:hypothetical protein
LKKATLALVLIAASALPASTTAFAQDIGGANPRPQVATSSTFGGVVEAVLAYLGF